MLLLTLSFQKILFRRNIIIFVSLFICVFSLTLSNATVDRITAKAYQEFLQPSPYHLETSEMVDYIINMDLEYQVNKTWEKRLNYSYMGVAIQDLCKHWNLDVKEVRICTSFLLSAQGKEDELYNVKILIVNDNVITHLKRGYVEGFIPVQDTQVLILTQSAKPKFDNGTLLTLLNTPASNQTVVVEVTGALRILSASAPGSHFNNEWTMYQYGLYEGSISSRSETVTLLATDEFLSRISFLEVANVSVRCAVDFNKMKFTIENREESLQNLEMFNYYMINTLGVREGEHGYDIAEAMELNPIWFSTESVISHRMDSFNSFFDPVRLLMVALLLPGVFLMLLLLLVVLQPNDRTIRRNCQLFQSWGVNPQDLFSILLIERGFMLILAYIVGLWLGSELASLIIPTPIDRISLMTAFISAVAVLITCFETFWEGINLRKLLLSPLYSSATTQEPYTMKLRFKIGLLEEIILLLVSSLPLGYALITRDFLASEDTIFSHSLSFLVPGLCLCAIPITLITLRLLGQFLSVSIKRLHSWQPCFTTLFFLSLLRKNKKVRLLFTLLVAVLSYVITINGLIVTIDHNITEAAYYDVGADFRVNIGEKNPQTVVKEIESLSGVAATTVISRMTLIAVNTSEIEQYDLLGIDISSYGDAAYWRGKYGDLKSLIQLLGEDTPELECLIFEKENLSDILVLNAFMIPISFSVVPKGTYHRWPIILQYEEAIKPEYTMVSSRSLVLANGDLVHIENITGLNSTKEILVRLDPHASVAQLKLQIAGVCGGEIVGAKDSIAALEKQNFLSTLKTTISISSFLCIIGLFLFVLIFGAQYVANSREQFEVFRILGYRRRILLIVFLFEFGSAQAGSLALALGISFFNGLFLLDFLKIRPFFPASGYFVSLQILLLVSGLLVLTTAIQAIRLFFYTKRSVALTQREEFKENGIF